MNRLFSVTVKDLLPLPQDQPLNLILGQKYSLTYTPYLFNPILTLPFHLRLRYPSRSSPSDSLTNILSISQKIYLTSH